MLLIVYFKLYSQDINIKDNDSLQLNVSNQELEERKAKWFAPELKHKRGVLFKYANSVSCASEGCTTDNFK